MFFSFYEVSLSINHILSFYFSLGVEWGKTGESLKCGVVFHLQVFTLQFLLGLDFRFYPSEFLILSLVNTGFGVFPIS